MKNYRVVFEIEIQAENPKEAAKITSSWLKEDGEDFIYVVQEEETDKIFTVNNGDEEEFCVIECDDYIPLIK